MSSCKYRDIEGWIWITSCHTKVYGDTSIWCESCSTTHRMEHEETLAKYRGVVRTLKLSVGTCACGVELKDKRSTLCSDCHKKEQISKLSVDELKAVQDFNDRWEQVHGIKHCDSCLRSYDVDDLTKCTIFPLMENNVACKDIAQR